MKDITKACATGAILAAVLMACWNQGAHASNNSANAGHHGGGNNGALGASAGSGSAQGAGAAQSGSNGAAGYCDINHWVLCSKDAQKE